MSITKEFYGEIDESKVYAYTLDNGKGLVAQILSYGGIITKLIYQGTDVVLGRDNFSEYLDNDGYYGALIGRNSNRIDNAEFVLNEKIYKLYANDGKNNLHGGKIGFNSKVWEVEEVEENNSIILTLTSPDGEEGFPGNVEVKVTYTLADDNAIIIHYEGVSDSDTILNMTNHTYFNLNGHSSGTVDGHTLWMASSFYTPNNDECIPTGEVLSVKNTPFDFSTNETLGERFISEHEQVKAFGGFDHNFALDGYGYRLAAKLTGDKSDITMEMFTDQSAVQLYTGNMIDEDRICKDGTKYPKHGALCLETQAFPNFTKYSHFPNGILRKGGKYDTITAYRFKK